MGQKYAAYDAQGKITGFYDSIDSPVPKDVQAIKITDQQWQSCLRTPGHLIQNGELIAPAPPTAAEKLAKAQQAKIAVLSSACRSAIYAGFTSYALGAPYRYPAQNTDQQNLSASVLTSLFPNRSAEWTTDFWCADSDGNWALRAHTAAQIQQVGSDSQYTIFRMIAKKVALSEQVMAATTLDAVAAIVWSETNQD